MTFLQVADEQVTDGKADDGIPVDQLGRAELAPCAERPERRRRLRPEHVHLVEQLIEAHRFVRPQRPAVDGERELEAVADCDVAQRPAFHREDRGDTTQHSGFHRPPRWRGVTERDELGEAFWVSQFCHQGDQVLRCPRVQYPAEARPDHVGTNQHDCADPQVARGRHPAVGPFRTRPGERRLPPVGVPCGVGPARHPPLLPGVTRLIGQPAQQPDHSPPASLLCSRAVVDEARSGKHAGEQWFAFLLDRPGRRRRSRRELLPELTHVRADRRHAGANRGLAI